MYCNRIGPELTGNPLLKKLEKLVLPFLAWETGSAADYLIHQKTPKKHPAVSRVECKTRKDRYETYTNNVASSPTLVSEAMARTIAPAPSTSFATEESLWEALKHVPGRRATSSNL